MTKGNQVPTFQVVGKYAYSHGDLVADMFEEETGASFYECQRYELKLYMAKKKDGSPAAMTICLVRPRQNGKSHAARYYSAYAGDFEHKRTLYSAHNGKTTQEMFSALCKIYDDPIRYPEYAANVKKIVKTRGIQSIQFKDWMDADGVWHDGGLIDFNTRTNSGARGGTYEVIVLDEAQELTDAEYDALLPTISAGSDLSDLAARPQIIMLGTPPGPTCNGTVFRRMHDAAHKDQDPDNAWWLEWGYVAEDINKADITIDNCVELALQTNPAMGYRIAPETVRNEFVSMSKDGFARERLGWWPAIAAVVDFALNHKKWEACASMLMKPEGKTAYAVRFSTDGAVVTLCGAVCPVNGKARISMIDQRDTTHGTQWLAEWLRVRYKTASCVVIDGRNGVDFLIEKIADVWIAKGCIIKPSGKDVVAAATQLCSEINEDTVTWYKPQEILNDSAVTSTKRPISGGWGFGGENSDPIQAASLALWACRTTKRDPSRKARIG